MYCKNILAPPSPDDPPELLLRHVGGYEVDGHVEVVLLELVRHLTEGLQRVLLLGLLEPEGLQGLRHLHGYTLGAPPVAWRYNA